MEACCHGFLGGIAPSSSVSTEVVVPEGSAPARGADGGASTIELLGYEMMFTQTPLAMASYPAIAFRIAQANPKVLKASLAAALARHPSMAGRIRGRAVALTHEGVPFTVAESPEKRAPERIEEAQLLHLADFRRPVRVRRGLEPLMTVRLTRFRDGSAILAFCRSHALLDGSSAWAFLHCWARAARGEAATAPGHAERAALHAALPSEERLDEVSKLLLGRPLQNSWTAWAVGAVFPVVCPAYDWAFLAGLTGDLERPRIFLSDGELARIKEAAAPQPGADGDGWVSTQEALCAYILWTAARATLPPGSAGRTTLATILDARKAIGLEPGHLFGAGLAFMRINFVGILQLSLRETAAIIHERSKTACSKERVRDAWQLFAGAATQGLDFDAMGTMQPMRREYDICLVLNNQSKRELPDFGAEGSGGPAEAVVTNAGPTLILPTKGGLDIFLDSSLLAAAKGTAGRAAALAALRQGLPKVDGQ